MTIEELILRRWSVNLSSGPDLEPVTLTLTTPYDINYQRRSVSKTIDQDEVISSGAPLIHTLLRDMFLELTE